MQPAATAPTLEGRRILLVEDEYVIAEETAGFLEDVGVVVLGPVPSPAAGFALLSTNLPPDGAVLDVNLAGEPVWPLVDALAAAGIPVVLATGYDSGVIPPAYEHHPRCQKPVSARLLVLALTRHLSPRT